METTKFNKLLQSSNRVKAKAVILHYTIIEYMEEIDRLNEERADRLDRIIKENKEKENEVRDILQKVYGSGAGKPKKQIYYGPLEGMEKLEYEYTPEMTADQSYQLFQFLIATEKGKDIYNEEKNLHLSILNMLSELKRLKDDYLINGLQYVVSKLTTQVEALGRRYVGEWGNLDMFKTMCLTSAEKAVNYQEMLLKFTKEAGYSNKVVMDQIKTALDDADTRVSIAPEIEISKIKPDQETVEGLLHNYLSTTV